jgi:hypothetical protein
MLLTCTRLLLQAAAVTTTTTATPASLYSLALRGGHAANHTIGRRYAYDSGGRELAHFQTNSSCPVAQALDRCEALCSSEPHCVGLTLNSKDGATGSGVLYDCYTVNETKAVGTTVRGVSYLRHLAPVAPAQIEFPIRGWSISCGLFDANNSAIYPEMNLLTEGAPVEFLPSLAARGVGVIATRDVELPFRAGPDGHAPCRYDSDAGRAACMDTLAELFSTSEQYARWSGIGLDEWTLGNKSTWPHKGGAVPNASKILQAGFREGRRRYPKTFAAAWVSGPDDAYAELMHDGTFDLCMIEGYSVCWLPNHCSPTIEGYFPRLEWARREGFINRTLFAFGWLVSADADGPFKPPLNVTHPNHIKPRCDADGCDNPNGWTVATLNSSMRKIKATFPEMPGVLMWGGDRGGCSKSSLELIRAASELSAALWPDYQPPTAMKAAEVLTIKTDDWLPQWCNLQDANESAGTFYQLGYADAMEKVFSTDMPPAPPCGASEVVVRMARGERMSVQLVLTPTQPLSACMTAIPDGTNNSATVYRIGYTTVAWTVRPDNRTGLYPDALVPAAEDNMIPLEPGRHQSFWVEVTVPLLATTEREFYTRVYIATITAQGQRTPVCVIIKAILWDFGVPAPQDAHQLLGGKFQAFEPSHVYLQSDQSTLVNLQQPEPKALRANYENFARHRVNSYVWMAVTPTVIATISRDLTRVTLNTSAFDEQVAWLLAHGVKEIRFPPPGPCHSAWMRSYLGYAGKPLKYLQSHTQTMNASWTFFSVDGVGPMHLPVFVGDIANARMNPQFVSLFNLVNTAIAKHLGSKGWSDIAVAAFTDEPQFNASADSLKEKTGLMQNFTTAEINNFTRFAVTSVARLYKQLQPPVRLQQTAGDPTVIADKDMRELVDRWLINHEPYTLPGMAESLAALRKERPNVTTLLYHNALPVVDLPAIRVRSFPWQVWRTNYAMPATRRFGLQGTLSWYTNTHWEENNGFNMWLSANTGPAPSFEGPTQSAGEIGHAAGLANILYPPRGAQSEAPISSVRWDLMSKGLEDAEYFYKLDALTDELEEHARCTDTDTDAATRTGRYCLAVKAARSALDAVGSVVWDFPKSKNLSSAPYSLNVTLMHSVLDTVARQISAVQAVLADVKQFHRKPLHTDDKGSETKRVVLWNEFTLASCNLSAFALDMFGITQNAGNAQNGAAVTMLGQGTTNVLRRHSTFEDHWPRILVEEKGSETLFGDIPPGMHGCTFADYVTSVLGSVAKIFVKTDDRVDSLPSKTAAPLPRWHSLEFGANLGYMGDPCASNDIIRQAAADGVITKLRAMDPFPAGYSGNWTPATAPAISSGWIQKILNAHPTTSMLISLNTYPYRLPSDFGARYQHYLPTVDWKAIFSRMPASFNYSNHLSDMARYTNRAALFTAEGASLADYTSKLAQLRGNLSAAGLGKRVAYEIGK